jgi:phage terminase large subunit-like protein
MVRAMWNRALIEEMETDGQVHDDQLDALARAFTEISRDGDAMDAFLSGKARA